MSDKVDSELAGILARFIDSNEFLEVWDGFVSQKVIDDRNLSFKQICAMFFAFGVTDMIKKTIQEKEKKENRKNNIQKSFTQEQLDFICYQIGDWYLMMKSLLEGQHNLGYMKEKLKVMICGEPDE